MKLPKHPLDKFARKDQLSDIRRTLKEKSSKKKEKSGCRKMENWLEPTLKVEKRNDPRNGSGRRNTFRWKRL